MQLSHISGLFDHFQEQDAKERRGFFFSASADAMEFWPKHTTVPLGDWLEKKSTSYNHKTTIWVSHEYYLNPEFHKILSRAFWVIAILVFSPYGARVDFKGLIS